MKKSLLIVFMALLMPAIALAQNKALKFIATQGYASTLIKPQGDDRLEIPETLLTNRTADDGEEYVELTTSFTYSGWFNLYDWFQLNKTMGSGLLMIGQRQHANNNPSIGLVVLRPADYSNTNKRCNGGILKLACGDALNSSVAGNLTGDNTTLNLDEWFYLTLVYDLPSKEIRVYKNAEPIMTRTLAAPLRLLPDNPGIIYTGSFAMNGMCDELQFWTKALTDAEVQTAYYSADAVPGLDLWYDFNEVVPAEPAEPTEGEGGEGSEGGETEEPTVPESGTFANKGTTEKGKGINAVYYHAANAKASYTGGVTNLVTFTEKTPELVDGREIQTLPTYAITVPEVANGTLTVMNGDESLAAGTHNLPVGSNLTITAQPAEGYFLTLLKYAGQYIASGTTVPVTEDAAIEVAFTNASYALTVAETEATYTLTALNGTELDLASVPEGTEVRLDITAWPETKTLKQVTLNGEAIAPQEDGSYIFTVNGESSLAIELRDLELFTVTFPASVPNGTLTVKGENDTALNSGDTVLEGSTITVEATANSGYSVLFIKINGESVESGVKHTVTDNVNIEAEMAQAVMYVPGYQKNGSSNHQYSFRFSESVLGSHVTGSCDEPAEVGTTDLRARSFTYSAWVKVTNPSVRNRDPKGRIMGDIQEGMTGTDGAFSVAVENGNLVLRTRVYSTSTNMPGLTALVTGTKLDLDEWAFLTVVADNEAKTISLYKNGTLCGSLDTSKDSDGNEAYGVGLLPDASSFYAFDFTCAGYLEEAQVWTKALTPNEIKRSTRLSSTNHEGLVALFRPRKDDMEMTNLGSVKDVTAGMYSGMYTSSRWVNPTAQLIFDAGPAHDPERVSVTLVQPSDNIGTFAVTGEDNRLINESAYLFEALNVDLSGISGATVNGIKVVTNGVETKYALNELPFIVEGNSEISLEYEVINTITFSYTGEHGKITLKVNDEEPVEVTEPIDIPKNATLVITAIPDEHYELTKADINGETIYDLYKLEEESTDGTIDHDFYDNEYTYQAGVRNIDLALTFNLERVWLIAEVVDAAGDDTDLYPAFSDNEGTSINEDTPAEIQVPYGTEVCLSIWSVPSDSYASDGDHNIISKVVDYPYDDATGTYLDPVDVTSMLEEISVGTEEDRIYSLGAVTRTHWFFIYQELLSGIATIGADKDSPLQITDGIITISGDALIEVTDMSGRTIARANGSTLDATTLVKGVYIAKATLDNKVYTLKFIKL